jgi:RNA polymerase sigma-70 factor (ECF subfamily)
MVTLWHKADLFDSSKSSLGTWLYRVARNRRIDIARRDRVDYVDPAEYALDIPDEQTPDADGQIDAQTREDVLRTAMTDLPEEQRVLVRLAFFESLSHSEIAARTGLPLGTVKSRIRLAFSRLRRTLEAGGVEDAA